MSKSSTPKKSGADFAQYALHAVLQDRAGNALKRQIDKAYTMFGGTHELDVFCATIQNAIRRAGPLPTAQLLSFVKEIGQCSYAIKNLSTEGIGNTDEDDAVCMGIGALAEKSGYLSDLCLGLLGETAACVGSFEDWANLKPKATEDEPAAGA